jgi:hypothetical protein
VGGDIVANVLGIGEVGAFKEQMLNFASRFGGIDWNTNVQS